MPKIYIALVHHPVINKNGETIASAITNLDLHDIARAARTYGVITYYVITPLPEQQTLAERIIRHWTDGFGAEYNPKRQKALDLVKLTASIAESIDDIVRQTQKKPLVVATCARNIIENRKGISFEKLKAKLNLNIPVLLLMGTAWGLSQATIADADFLLEPIRGTGEYNHLSVRCAAAIILDRICGM